MLCDLIEKYYCVAIAIRELFFFYLHQNKFSELHRHVI